MEMIIAKRYRIKTRNTHAQTSDPSETMTDATIRRSSCTKRRPRKTRTTLTARKMRNERKKFRSQKERVHSRALDRVNITSNMFQARHSAAKKWRWKRAMRRTSSTQNAKVSPLSTWVNHADSCCPSWALSRLMCTFKPVKIVFVRMSPVEKSPIHRAIVCLEPPSLNSQPFKVDAFFQPFTTISASVSPLRSVFSDTRSNTTFVVRTEVVVVKRSESESEVSLPVFQVEHDFCVSSPLSDDPFDGSAASDGRAEG
mmetsp:Transcript_31999/g.85698  ORF Transcript_31999/g.85698 Transcript_31999/m.85698 type:complete len:256 (-) Transcript_31999:457-1224(-)